MMKHFLICHVTDDVDATLLMRSVDKTVRLRLPVHLQGQRLSWTTRWTTHTKLVFTYRKLLQDSKTANFDHVIYIWIIVFQFVPYNLFHA